MRYITGLALSDLLSFLLAVQISALDAEFSCKRSVFSQWEPKAKHLQWRCYNDMDHYLSELCIFHFEKDLNKSSF